MAANTQFVDIGKAFVEHYYKMFDSTRTQLASMYNEKSMLTFENEQFMGQSAIMQKLTTLNFQSVAHQVVTCDSQPTDSNGILTFVTGKLAVDGNATTPLNFAQVFLLYPTATGSWYVHNDMFRLNYG
jgi:hypothetical protein|eukprot:CAMPEP_0119360506 /NCGR_PEP_ID=MMETSP1334-20130426/8084_1 /TAXON_ID=127549 /ORGANISM="Calcidiscus leptoporus, Strain RCC1130" /LENGTH=127 /DNA_ID=CAMNT_0007375351 /DNA_START=27 /DNA_END=410 /DNA_ORIENTATION=-